MTRRSFIGKSTGMALAPALATQDAAAEREPETDATGSPAPPRTALVRHRLNSPWAPDHASHYELLTVQTDPKATPLDGGGWFTLAPIHRREVPEVIERPQPEPVATELQPFSSSANASLYRHWREEDTRHCRLCAVCNAGSLPSKHPGLILCARLVPNTVTEADAPLYAE